jgi:hypothetical protein
MYLFDPIQPTELFHEHQEAVMRDARLARQLRAARRQERTTSERRTAWLPGRAIALWGGRASLSSGCRRSRLEMGVEMMDVVTTKTRKWAAVMAKLMTMLLAASVALAEAPTQCEVAYLTSGPTA